MTADLLIDVETLAGASPRPTLDVRWRLGGPPGPGAVNLPATEHLTADGRVRPGPEIRARLARLGVTDRVPVGAYCGSGVVAAHAVLALHRAGRTDAALYVGSWSNWITDPDRPTATGEAP